MIIIQHVREVKEFIYILDLFTYILFNIIIHKFIYHDYVNDETFIGIFYID